MGYSPNTEIELGFTCALPVSAEDAAWLHTTASVEYANRVVHALQDDDITEAKRHLNFFRNEGHQSRGMGKEALNKLQALGFILELYQGDLIVPDIDRLRETQAILEEIQATPRPECR